ncbi:MAG: Stp1/IreP family PP2C-type Ser/Thr phosphatase [Clostridia bacterium]|nr:Stp1/IreP family PP2C-type Ser/Thr phosphatase [Clostridia bacterium]
MKILMKTDTGRLRDNNQDSMVALMLPDDAAFAAVCDGMGGANGGNVASALAVAAIEDKIRTEYRPEMDDDAVCELLATAVDIANETVYAKAQEDPELFGMGTTAVLALIRDNTAILANVGDSRGVLFSKDGAMQLTKDHSYVQVMIDNGSITEEEALTHPRRNIITRAVGIMSSVLVDTFVYPIQEDDVILLCSDGLTNEISYDSILTMMEEPVWENLAEKLVAQANENGGRDNVTVVLIRNQA